MRDEFAKTVHELARRDKNLILITGDLGFGVLTGFAADLPDQFINAGVSEQNLTGLAAGLALEGKKVFTYSIGVFNTFRCLEQIRNDLCHHQLPVTVVTVGGGLSYGALGASHHATEDLAVMRSLPHLCVLAPGDKVETRLATRAAYEMNGPCYLRLSRGGDPVVYTEEPAFEVGRAIHVQGDGDVALIGTGGILPNVVAAADALQKDGLSVSVYSAHTLKPFDEPLIGRLARSTRLIVTVEEHIVHGGLGGAAAEVLAGIPGPRPPLVRLGLSDGHVRDVGDQEYLRDRAGLSPDGIRLAVRRALERL